MKKADANKLPRYTPNPIFVGLPVYLKDPKNYEKIQKALLETLASTHSHSDLEAWNKCPPCQRRVLEHKQMLKGLGFKDGKQYMAWKKTLDIIINKKRDPIR